MLDAKRQRLLTCQDAVPELLAKGQLREAKSVCHEALEKLDELSAAEAADVWYLLGLVHDIAHEHEEALIYNERPEIWPYLADTLSAS
eukprot:Skav235881  [mRNA]  locus=scaffold1192:99452:99981:- [translate_table: standard]